MKSIRFIGVIALAIVVVAGAVVGAQIGSGEELAQLSLNLPRNTMANIDVNYEMATDDLPMLDEMMVYKVNNPVITTDSVQEIGAKLEFDGSAGLIDGDTKIAMLDEIENEVKQLSVWVNSGAIEYAIVFPDMLYPSTKPNLPSAEEAAKIAVAFLERYGLLPADAKTQDIEVVSGGSYAVEHKIMRDYWEEIEAVPGGSYAVEHKITDERLEEYDTHLLVRFPRDIDGLPVVGAGNKLGVRIGDDGKVIRSLKVWRDVEPLKEMKIKSPLEAYVELKSGEGYSGVVPGSTKVVIEDVLLGYWMEPPHQVQDHVQPVYIFTGDCLNEDGEYVDAYTGYCEALIQ